MSFLGTLQNEVVWYRICYITDKYVHSSIIKNMYLCPLFAFPWVHPVSVEISGPYITRSDEMWTAKGSLLTQCWFFLGKSLKGTLFHFFCICSNYYRTIRCSQSNMPFTIVAWNGGSERQQQPVDFERLGQQKETLP